MTPEEIQARKEHIKRLTNKLLDVAEGESHTLLLEALINAFVAVAETHSCCTRIAAYAAELAAERLQAAADVATRPEGIPLH